MSTLTVILVIAGILLGVGLLAVLVWLLYTSYLDRVERRLAKRKGLYRELVASLATRERALLEPEIRRMGTLLDLEALEAVLEEQARGTSDRPAWLLDVYDRLGLVDKYIGKLRTARKWRERAFAAELLGRVGNANAVPALLETVQATRTEDTDVREIALRALARIADPRAVDSLVEALRTAEVWLAPRIADILTRHGDHAVDPLINFLEQPGRHPARSWAANVLGEVGAQRAFPTLVKGLSDLEDDMRAKSATALGRLGNRRGVTYLLENLLNDPTPFVRSRVAAALGKFDDPDVIERLVRALGDPAWWVRMRSVEALEQIGPVAEGPLLVALDDTDAEIRIRSAAALERLGVAASLVGMIERGERVPEAMETLVKFANAGAKELLAELLVHPSAEVRSGVVTAIRRALRSDLAPELIRVAAEDGDPPLRAQAFDTLRVLQATESVPVALQGLLDPDDRVRTAAIALVGDLGGPDTIEQLRARTGDPGPTVRAAAARSLGLMRSAAAAPEFERLLLDPDPSAREAAAAATGLAGSRHLAPLLIERLGDAEESVRRSAAQALGALGDRSAVAALVEGFPAASPELREAIVEAVSRLDPPTVAGLVDVLVEDRDTAGKLGAVYTLSRLQSPALSGVLERLWQDPDPVVRTAAVEAFGRVSPERVGGSGESAPVAVALRDPDESVRAAAVDACSRLRVEEEGRTLIDLLESDPSSRVRERAALAIGHLRVPGGDAALLAACRRPEPVAVRAAAALASGVYDEASIVARVVEMPDEAVVREQLRGQLESDPAFRFLGRSLAPARHLELRALGALTAEEAQVSLVHGMQSILDAGERIRLISGLRAFQGDQSRGALLQVAQRDPSPEVRTAALTAAGGLLEGEELLEVAQRALRDPSLLVRRAAVNLFARISPERGLPVLLQTLRPDDDPAVLAAVAELAERSFHTFIDLVLVLPRDGQEAALVGRVARYIHHPELALLLPAMARSESPEVREAIALAWRHRPEMADLPSLATLALDPVVGVRREVVSAAAAAEQWDVIERMAEDPDPDVRREVALVLARTPTAPQGHISLQRLALDGEMPVRAAAYVARLLQGIPVPLPPELDPRAAADALRAAGDLVALRETARTAPAEDRRLAAALALALLHDDVAREVARTDPVPSIRHRVGGALELAPARAGEDPV